MGGVASGTKVGGAEGDPGDLEVGGAKGGREVGVVGGHEGGEAEGWCEVGGADAALIGVESGSEVGGEVDKKIADAAAPLSSTLFNLTSRSITINSRCNGSSHTTYTLMII